MTPGPLPAAEPFDPRGGLLPPAVGQILGAEAPRAILLVAGAGARRSGWAAQTALALAQALGEGGRPLLLADLSLATQELGELLGARDPQGVADVFLFGASLRHVALSPAGRSFQFLPAGPRAPDPAEVLMHPRWERLLAEYGRRGTTLLAYVPADAAGLEVLAKRFGHAVVLAGNGEQEDVVAVLPSDSQVVAALRPVEGADLAAAPAPPAGHEPGPLDELPALEPFPAPAVEAAAAEVDSWLRLVDEPSLETPPALEEWESGAAPPETAPGLEPELQPQPQLPLEAARGGLIAARGAPHRTPAPEEGGALPVDPFAADAPSEHELLDEPYIPEGRPTPRRSSRRWIWAGTGLVAVTAGWFSIRWASPVSVPVLNVRIDARRVGLPLLDRLRREAPRSSASSAAPAAGAADNAREQGAGTVPGAASADAAEAGQAAEAGAGGTASAPPLREVPLPYSVNLEAHRRFEVAQTRVDLLRAAEPGIEFYVTPVLVDSVAYYRVMAGPAADTAAAMAIMRRLVEAGHKTAVEPWTVRATIWAFDLGEYQTREAAQARVMELSKLSVPAYVVEQSGPQGTSRFRLYGGAFEGPAETDLMARNLRTVGVTAPLAKRRGRPAA